RHTLFSLPPSLHHRALHSFPTRRSSDLDRHDGRTEIQNVPVAFFRVAGEQPHRNHHAEQTAMKRHAALPDFEQGQGIVKERAEVDRKSTRLNSSHVKISYAVFCLKKKKK